MANPFSTRALHQLRTAVASARNLGTVINVSVGSEITANAAGEYIDVRGIPYLRIYNTDAGAVTLLARLDDSTDMPLADLDGSVVSVAAGGCQLVDVRGAEHILPSAACSYSLVV